MTYGLGSFHLHRTDTDLIGLFYLYRTDADFIRLFGE